MLIKYMLSNTTEMTTSPPGSCQRLTLDVLTAVVSKLQLSISALDIFEAILEENKKVNEENAKKRSANRLRTLHSFLSIFCTFCSLIAKP